MSFEGSLSMYVLGILTLHSVPIAVCVGNDNRLGKSGQNNQNDEIAKSTTVEPKSRIVVFVNALHVYHRYA